MEERQRVEKPIVIAEIDDNRCLPDIREKISMRELNALGRALGSAGEKNNGGVGGSQETAPKLPSRGERMAGPCDQLRATRDRRPDILQKVDT